MSEEKPETIFSGWQGWRYYILWLLILIVVPAQIIRQFHSYYRFPDVLVPPTWLFLCNVMMSVGLWMSLFPMYQLKRWGVYAAGFFLVVIGLLGAVESRIIQSRIVPSTSFGIPTFLAEIIVAFIWLYIFVKPVWLQME